MAEAIHILICVSCKLPSFHKNDTRTCIGNSVAFKYLKKPTTENTSVKELRHVVLRSENGAKRIKQEANSYSCIMHIGYCHTAA